MSTLSEDPIMNGVVNGIKRGITVALDNKCYGGAAILMLSAMDAMAFLVMPEAQDDVIKTDFIKWTEKYIRFPGAEQLTGADLYGARCAMVHSYGVRSRMSRRGECRMLGYVNCCDPPIQFNPDVSKEVVLVSLEGLRDALFTGIDRFLIDVYKNRDSPKARLADKRFETLVHEYPANGL
jgi:hypothetical protein